MGGTVGKFWKIRKETKWKSQKSAKGGKEECQKMCDINVECHKGRWEGRTWWWEEEGGSAVTHYLKMSFVTLDTLYVN